MYMAIDQYGNTYHGLKHPRKKLLERLGYSSSSSAHKMYVEKETGETVHIGYVIGGLWLTLYRVEPVEKPA